MGVAEMTAIIPTPLIDFDSMCSACHGTNEHKSQLMFYIQHTTVRCRYFILHMSVHVAKGIIHIGF